MLSVLFTIFQSQLLKMRVLRSIIFLKVLAYVQTQDSVNVSVMYKYDRKYVLMLFMNVEESVVSVIDTYEGT